MIKQQRCLVAFGHQRHVMRVHSSKIPSIFVEALELTLMRVRSDEISLKFPALWWARCHQAFNQASYLITRTNWLMKRPPFNSSIALARTWPTWIVLCARTEIVLKCYSDPSWQLWVVWQRGEWISISDLCICIRIWLEVMVVEADGRSCCVCFDKLCFENNMNCEGNNINNTAYHLTPK